MQNCKNKLSNEKFYLLGCQHFDISFFVGIKSIKNEIAKLGICARNSGNLVLSSMKIANMKNKNKEIKSENKKI